MSKIYEFEVTCKEDYVEDAECYWSKGKSYHCQTKNFKTFEIDTNVNTVGCVGEGYLCNDFHEYFETDFRIKSLPFGIEWFSDELRDAIYRNVWKEHVMEDIEAHAEDIDVELSNDEIEVLAERYVYEGDYDCNLDYWQNIENLIYNR